MTTMAMTDTAQLLESGSFALVAALGLYLLRRQGQAASWRWRAAAMPMRIIPSSYS